MSSHFSWHAQYIAHVGRAGVQHIAWQAQGIMRLWRLLELNVSVLRGLACQLLFRGAWIAELLDRAAEDVRSDGTSCFTFGGRLERKARLNFPECVLARALRQRARKVSHNNALHELPTCVCGTRESAPHKQSRGETDSPHPTVPRHRMSRVTQLCRSFVVI